MSEPIYIVFDGPPGPEGGRFVEVETASGEGRKVGEWTQHGEFWHLGPMFAEEVVEAPTAQRSALWLIQKLTEVNFTEEAANNALEAIAHIASRALAGQKEGRL